MRFTKMNGAGNDFVVIDNMDLAFALSADEIAAICDRHFGVGGDGLILVEPSESCDVRMNYYNQDGSVAEMCGNGVRCLGKYAADHGIVAAGGPFLVETRAGTIGVSVLESGRRTSRLRVDMGEVRFEAAAVPVISDKAEVLGETVTFEGVSYTYGCASMGNPHMALVVPDFEGCPIETLGPKLECDPMFPNKCNISFAQVIDKNHIRMDTWERGVGRTLACGTGTCACTAVLNRLGLVDSCVEAKLSGGTLTIEIEGRRIFMTGPAQIVFEGDYEI